MLGCEKPEDRILRRGLEFQYKGEYREAVTELAAVMRREPKSLAALRAARETVKIYMFDLRSYEKAIEGLKFLILYSPSADERWRAQRQIAQIYFDNLVSYDKALVEFNKLLGSHISKTEQIVVRLDIARCHYHLGQLDHSWTETSLIMVEQDITEDQLFDTLFLQSNIRLAQKNFLEAAKKLEVLLEKFPERSKKENVGINLALCYEELGNGREALRVLELLKKDYEPKDYIELRIKKVRQRFMGIPRKKLGREK
jgi:tetratricopeptide (TPR) repeat protein